MNVFVTMAISLGLGLLIGLQRERVEARLGGIRTFPLISLFGTICGLLAQQYGWGVLAAGFLTVFGVLLVSNLTKPRPNEAEDSGITTEVAALLTFALGAYLVTGSRSVAVVATGIMAVLLHLKRPMHRFVDRMGEHDMAAIMQFVIISFIILPLLPNQAYGPYAVLNPFDIWRMIVLIVGISLSGYIAYKIWGQKAGAFLGGIFGGLISSTATTVSYARRSRGEPKAHDLAVFVIMIASAIAFVRVLIEIAAVASNSFRQMALPLAAMGVWMALVSVGVYFVYRGQSGKLPQPSNPAELKSALIFGALYALILFAVGAAKAHLGPTALYGIAIISGLTDMDAITLSLARMVEENRVDPTSGWRLILVASLANLMFKAGAGAMLGGWQFGLRLFVVFGISAAGGLGIFLMWPETR